MSVHPHTLHKTDVEDGGYPTRRSIPRYGIVYGDDEFGTNATAPLADGEVLVGQTDGPPVPVPITSLVPGTPTGTAGGALSGEYPNPDLGLGVVTDTHVASANKDGMPSTPSMRTLGTGSQQACAGNDTRLLPSRALWWLGETSTTPRLGSWTTRSGGSLAVSATQSTTNGNNLRIQATGTGSGFTLLGGQHTADLGSGDVWAFARIRSPASTSNIVLNYVLGVRMQDGSANNLGGYILLIYNDGGTNNGIFFCRLNSSTGALTDMVTGISMSNAVPGWDRSVLGYPLTAEIWTQGSKIYAAVNGITRFWANDTTFTSGRALVGVRDSTSATHADMRLEEIAIYNGTRPW